MARTGVDPRTDRLLTIWGVGGPGQGYDLFLTPDRTERDQRQAVAQRGVVAYLHSGTNGEILDQSAAPELRPVYRRGGLLGNDRDLGDLVGYSWIDQDPQGLRRGIKQQRSRADEQVPEVMLAYLGQQTGADIHSRVQTVTQGPNVLRFNLAAGGYLESWQVGGTEILNRANSWARGLQQHLRWTDLAVGDLRGHCASQAGSHFATGLDAQGSVLVSLQTEPNPAGGLDVKIVARPLELDPNGRWSVPGWSTDHGGDVSHPVLWRDFEVATTITLEHGGTPGLHKLSTTWTVPETLVSRWFDTGLESGLFVDGRFDEVYVYRADTDTLTDVTAAADAVDWRRFSVSRLATFQDEQAAPTSATTLASGFGGVIAREAGPDLAVGLAGRLALPVTGAVTVDVNNYPEGTEVVYVTNRTGATGHDGGQCVLLGLNASLSSRWNHQDAVRRILAGTAVLNRFVAIGTLAGVRALIQSIPTEY